MLRRISVFLLAVLLVLSLAGNVAMAQTEPDLSDRGQPGADEPKDTGSPDDPNSWGSVASQLGDEGVMGKHSSNPFVSKPDQTASPQDIDRETPRDGLGNVARNDLGDHGVTVPCLDGQTPTEDNPCDPGSQLPAHGCVAAAAPLPGIVDENGEPIQPDCNAGPGNSPDPS